MKIELQSNGDGSKLGGVPTMTGGYWTVRCGDKWDFSLGFDEALGTVAKLMLCGESAHTYLRTQAAQEAAHEKYGYEGAPTCVFLPERKIEIETSGTGHGDWSVRQADGYESELTFGEALGCLVRLMLARHVRSAEADEK